MRFATRGEAPQTPRSIRETVDGDTPLLIATSIRVRPLSRRAAIILFMCSSHNDANEPYDTADCALSQAQSALMIQTMIDLGSVIRRRREAAGLSQLTFALAIGYTNNSDVSRIERGTQWPDGERLKLIAAALHCAVWELFAEAEGAHQGAGGVPSREGARPAQMAAPGYPSRATDHADHLAAAINTLSMSVDSLRDELCAAIKGMK